MCPLQRHPVFIVRLYAVFADLTNIPSVTGLRSLAKTAVEYRRSQLIIWATNGPKCPWNLAEKADGLV